MPLTVKVMERNGPAGNPTDTDITSTTSVFATKDEVAPPLNAPGHSIKINNSGTPTRSFWKHHFLNFSGTGTLVENIRLYFPNSINWTWGSGGTLYIGNRDSGDLGCPLSNYQQASGTVHITGYAIEDPTNGHAYYKSQSTPVKAYTNFPSTSPATIDSSIYTSFPCNSKAAVLQVKVDTAANGAQRGTQSPITLTWLWDEV